MRNSIDITILLKRVATGILQADNLRIVKRIRKVTEELMIAIG